MIDEKSLPYHFECSGLITRDPKEVFEYLDDHSRLSSHMGKSSWMMAGSRMQIEMDEATGKRVGSEIVMKGKMMGLALFIREKITERVLQQKKTWETFGPQKLVIIDQYRMGFKIDAEKELSNVTIFIDDSVPETVFGRTLGSALAKIYAKWCTKSMLHDCVGAFRT